MRLLRLGLLWWSFFDEVGVADSWRMTMTSTGNLDDVARLKRCVCGLRLVVRVAVCALTTVVFHDGRRWYLYRFLAGFLLIKRSTLFFLINKNGKSYALFKKNIKACISTA
jgi:hypothetical protein